MKVVVPKGKYVLGVSGGVDSMALLDMLAKMNGVELVVGHFNHGIRQESGLDESFVQNAAKSYGLVFESGRGRLGAGASEEDARRARYEFLERTVKNHQADKLITAHHQDDWIETALINIMRGSGRQGLSSIAGNHKVLRPLIKTSKAEILRYVKRHNLGWIDDSTNKNQDYLRNYLRINIVTKLTPADRTVLINNLEKVAILNDKLDCELATYSHKCINRYEFTNLPDAVGREIVAYLLRHLEIKNYDKYTVNRLSMAIKTARPDSVHPVKDKAYLKMNAYTAVFVTP